MFDRPRVLSFAVASLVAACAVSSGVASAATPTPADVEALIKRGNELRKQQKSQQALPLFQEAYQLTDTSRTAAQLGLCEFDLGYMEAADEHLTEALAGRNDWIEANRSTIEEAQRRVRAQMGEIAVVGGPADAEVTFNERPVGRLPLAPVRVAAGKVRVGVRAPGYVDALETVSVDGGGQQHVAINLARSGTTASAEADSGLPAPTTEPISTAPAQGADAESHWSPQRVAGASMIGVGVLSVATGVVMLTVDHRGMCDAPAGAVCDQRYQTAAWGWSLVGVGVAAGLIGGALVYGSSNTQVGLAASPSSLLAWGRF